jgi:hypothetical protein
VSLNENEDEVMMAHMENDGEKDFYAKDILLFTREMS